MQRSVLIKVVGVLALVGVLYTIYSLAAPKSAPRIALPATRQTDQADVDTESKSNPQTKIETKTKTDAKPSIRGIEAAWIKPTLVVTITKPTQAYANPSTTSKRVRVLDTKWYGAPSSLPVIEQRGEWVHVRVAQRPNRQTAWIQFDYETQSLSEVLDHLVVDLSDRRLLWYRSGKLKMDTRVILGKSSAPTPAGEFFVAFHAKPPSSGYGPFILVTSAHSDRLQGFGGIDDAIIALHGPVGASGGEIASGARLSSGCVRLQLDDLKRLAKIAPGTPLHIVP